MTKLQLRLLDDLLLAGQWTAEQKLLIINMREVVLNDDLKAEQVEQAKSALLTDRDHLLEQLAINETNQNLGGLIKTATQWNKMFPDEKVRVITKGTRHTWERDLPEMVQINGGRDVKDGSGRRATANSPLRVSCPRCGAGKGVPCWRLDARGVHGKPTTEHLNSGQFHRSRTAKIRKKVQ